MNLQDNIVKMEEQVDKLKCEIASMKVKLKEQDTLELKGGVGYYLRGWDGPVEGTLKIDTLTVTRGAFRATKELAEIADRNMVTRNCLEAYVHLIQGDGDGDFVINIGEKQTKHYYYDLTGKTKPIGSVCMLSKTAKILCKALNKGEIEL